MIDRVSKDRKEIVESQSVSISSRSSELSEEFPLEADPAKGPILRRLDEDEDLWRTSDGKTIYWQGHKLSLHDLTNAIWNWSKSGGYEARRKLVAHMHQARKSRREQRVGISDFVCAHRQKLLDEHVSRDSNPNSEKKYTGLICLSMPPDPTQIQRIYSGCNMSPLRLTYKIFGVCQANLILEMER